MKTENLLFLWKLSESFGVYLEDLYFFVIISDHFLAIGSFHVFIWNDASLGTSPFCKTETQKGAYSKLKKMKHM